MGKIFRTEFIFSNCANLDGARRPKETKKIVELEEKSTKAFLKGNFYFFK